LATLEHNEEVNSVAAVATADGETLFISGGKTAKIWNRAGSCLATIYHESLVISVAAITTADGKTLFITGSGDKAMVWSHEQIWTLRFCQTIQHNSL
jgi:hypothetical protein